MKAIAANAAQLTEAKEKGYTLAQPVALMNSDVLLMIRQKIDKTNWLFKQFGQFKYTEMGSKTFYGVELVSADGEKTLKASVYDITSDKFAPVFDKFVSLEKNEQGHVTGFKLLQDSVAFGVHVEVRELTEADKQGIMAVAQQFKGEGNEAKYAQKIKSLEYPKREIRPIL